VGSDRVHCISAPPRPDQPRHRAGTQGMILPRSLFYIVYATYAKVDMPAVVDQIFDYFHGHSDGGFSYEGPRSCPSCHPPVGVLSRMRCRSAEFVRFLGTMVRGSGPDKAAFFFQMWGTSCLPSSSNSTGIGRPPLTGRPPLRASALRDEAKMTLTRTALAERVASLPPDVVGTAVNAVEIHLPTPAPMPKQRGSRFRCCLMWRTASAGAARGTPSRQRGRHR
jgi:hypothetical protein